MSLRSAAITALVLLMPAMAARAQDCPPDQPDCAAGACPLPQLPYEEFISAPPSDRAGGNIPSVADRPFDPEAGDRILVRRFVVDGVVPNAEDGITPESVQAAADAAFARETGGAPEARLTVGHMVKVADGVTAFYRNKGYLVAKAFLPVQTVGSDNVVHIQVLEGRVSDVVVEGAKSYSVNVLRKPSLPLIGTTPMRDEVESALLYTQDYPGVRLFGTFRPGAQQGDTKLTLQVLDEDKIGFQLGGDNYGNKFTGQYRARGDAFWKDAIGLGDEFDVTLLEAFNPSNTTFGSANYAVPFGPRGFSGSLGASRNQFSVAGPLEILSLEGTITILQAGLDWRFMRYRFRNLRAGLLFGNKQSKLDAVQGQLTITDDNYNVGILSLDGDRVDTRFRGVDQGTFKVRRGISGTIGSGKGLDNHFTIYELRYSRLQSLGDTQTGIVRLRTQLTADPLSPLEQFSLAGPDAVRAYPVGQSLRDNGVFASAEYRVQAPGFARAAGPFGRAWGDLLQFGLFYDYAHGKDKAAGSPSVELAGYGASIQFGVPGTFQLLLQGAEPVTADQPSDGDNFRLYGEFSFKF